jgi:carbamate kinase
VLRLEGVDAVIDKDRAAAVLARAIDAEVLLILTNVDGVYTGWGTDRQKKLERLSVREAEELLQGSGLGKGSMAPKVEAAVAFVKGGRKSIIAKLDEGLDALSGNAGTVITE